MTIDEALNKADRLLKALEPYGGGGGDALFVLAKAYREMKQSRDEIVDAYLKVKK